MKVLRWVQNVAIVAAMVMAIYLADGMEVSRKDALAAAVIVGLALLILFGRVLKEEKEAER